MADKMDVDKPAAASAPTSPVANPSSNTNAPDLAGKIQKYFTQLTEGCGKPCAHPFCGSNPALQRFNLTRNQCAILSYSLATKDKTGTLLVANNKPATNSDGSYLDLPSLTALVKECNDTQVYSPLIRLFGLVFSTPALLNNSFVKPPTDISLDGNDIGIDMAALEEGYGLIQTLPQQLQGIMVASAGRLASELKALAARTSTAFQLRQYIILLDMPQLQEPENHQELLLPLLIAISRLPKVSLELISSNFIAQLSKDKFVRYLHVIKDAIALHALEKGDEFEADKDQLAISSVSILNLLHRVNLTKKYVKFDDFYLDAVNESISQTEDSLRNNYINWKKRDKFSYCNHSYLFTPETKAKILRIESAVQQYRQRADIINMAMLGFMTSPYLVLKVYRNNLIYSSLQALESIAKEKPEDLKKELKIKFSDEEGIDEGGVQKEWFQILVKQIFDPQYGMFVVEPETRTHWFNAQSNEHSDFDLIGKLLGLAIYNGNILDVHFPLLIYKKLQNFPVTLEDLPQINPELAKGLNQLLAFQGDVEENFGLNFQITFEVFGQQETHNLKLDGDQIAVTNENRQEYVDLYVKWLLVDSVSKQFSAFQKGFQAVCDSEAMLMFQPEELELLICGEPELDFEELEKNAEYENGFTENSPVVKNFWQVVHSLTLEQRKRLLFFCTGSDRAPIGGLGKLKLIIMRHGDDESRLPSAHTCFNHLLLPEYKSVDKLRSCILKAIENAEGFGMI